MNCYYENTNDLFIDGEIFKDIEGYNGDYQVSNLGRIKSFKKCREKDIIILEQIKDSHGYLYVNLSKNGKSEPKLTYALLFESFNNYKLKKGECIHHINKDPLDNILDNFQLMTKSEHHSLHSSGENNPRVKLKEQDVIQIRESNLPQKELAKMFGVHQVTISKIKTRRRWKHI